jgi:rhodanese-related sulfurtransferase
LAGSGKKSGCVPAITGQIRQLNSKDNTMKKLLALTAALVFSALVFAGEYPDISIKDLKKAIADKNVTVIDVNGTESWEKGHIPSALDFEKNSAAFAKILPQDKSALVVAYCGGPKCMAYKQAAQAAEKLGYKNVKHLSAGISGWKEAGEKTEKATSQTSILKRKHRRRDPVVFFCFC